jgi:hypothetical protein
MIGSPDMMSSVIPARLEYQCGHAALVSLPRIKGESSAQRNDRVAREKSAARTRSCDFCGPTIEVVHVAAPPVVVVEALPVAVVEAPPVIAAVAPPVNGHVAPVAVEDEPIPPVVRLVPKAERRPRRVTPKLIATPAPLPPVHIATKPRQPRPVVAAALRRYTVSFRVERVLSAADMRDALRQAQSIGATEVLAITRQAG